MTYRKTTIKLYIRDDIKRLLENKYGSLEKALNKLYDKELGQSKYIKNLSDFVDFKLDRTSDHKHSISLKEMYSYFLNFLKEELLVDITDLAYIPTKQQFRSSMEDMGILYCHGSKNIRTFKGVKLKGTEQDFEDITENFEFD